MATLTKVYPVSLPLAIRRFTLHFLEMCAVMCAGGLALDFVVFGAAGLLGYPGLVAQAPELSIVIIAVDYAVAMAVYMYVRGHPLQHNVEMSGSTLVAAIPLVAMFWVGWIPSEKLATWIGLAATLCGPLCLLMFLVMVARFDHYGGRVGAIVVPLATGTGEYTCSMHPEVRQAEPGRCPACGMKLVRRP